MTIPDYDVECDCDFCTEERNMRIKKFNERVGSGQITSPPSAPGGGLTGQGMPLFEKKIRQELLDELIELVRIDLRQDFDEELYITYEDFLWCIRELRPIGGE
jgi:hypothetical protein